MAKTIDPLLNPDLLETLAPRCLLFRDVMPRHEQRRRRQPVQIVEPAEFEIGKTP
jgi:hypothetical protein